MKIIHQNGYTKEELALYRITVYKNLVDSAQAIIFAMKKFRKEPRRPENRVSNLCNKYRKCIKLNPT
jgi:guanine nucleotide-binding protein G(i) subunit alpha